MSEPAVERTVLDNGLRVVSERVPAARSASIGVWVPVGSRDEEDGDVGAAHFLEHLLFKGTSTRSARDISEQIDAVGGDTNAYTSRESTVVHARVPAGHVDLGVDVLLDIVTDPAFRPDEVASERAVILEEIRMADDNPEDVVHALVGDGLFPGHPLGREVLGSAESVAGLTRDGIAGFFGRWYRPGSMVVAAAGAVDHERLAAAVQTRFGDVRGAATSRRVAPTPAAPRAMSADRPLEQTHLAWACRSIPLLDDRRYAMAVLNHVLGAGMSSRLFDEVRERRGLCYTVYSHLAAYGDTGVLSVYAATAPDRAAEVTSVVRHEIAALAADGITDRERDIAVGSLTGSAEVALEDSASRAGRLGGWELVAHDVPALDAEIERQRAVTVDEVNALASDLLAGPWVTAAVGPGADERGGR